MPIMTRNNLHGLVCLMFRCRLIYQGMNSNYAFSARNVSLVRRSPSSFVLIQIRSHMCIYRLNMQRPTGASSIVGHRRSFRSPCNRLVDEGSEERVVTLGSELLLHLCRSGHDGSINRAFCPVSLVLANVTSHAAPSFWNLWRA